MTQINQRENLCVSPTRSNVGEPVRDSIYVRTEAPNSELLKSETPGTQDRLITAINISEYEEKSENHSSLAI